MRPTSFDSDPAGPYHARAMGNPLRDRRTPSELAARGQVVEFEEKVSEFNRLSAMLEGELATLETDKLPDGWRNAPVSGRLSFGFADAQDAVAMLEGHVAATIDTVCQRCLEPFQLPLAVELRLMFGDEESVAQSGADFEVWELDDETLRPLDVVDEVLVMAMPLAAMHVDSPACRPADAVEAVGKQNIRPFASLKAQMDSKN